MKRFILLITILCTLFSCIRLFKREKLYVGTSVEFEPFEFYSDENKSEIIGLDIEIAERVAKELNMDLEIVVLEFDNLLNTLDRDEVDFVIAAITINDYRSLTVDFSKPYYRATQVLITKKGTDVIDSLEELKYKDVAALVGTTGSNIIQIYTKNVTPFNSVNEAIREVIQGKIDYVIIDEQPALHYLEDFNELMIVPIDFEPEYYGIAVKKGNIELLEDINRTLLKMQDDGTYNNLIEDYIK